MPKYMRGRKTRRTYRRRRYKRRSFASKTGRSMQRKSLSFVKKKYTTVSTVDVAVGTDRAEVTVSHIGGRNAANPAATITLLDCNPDNMLTDQMKLYQFFKITGVAFKLFFPEGTSPEATPVQWSMGYSSNQVIKPDVGFARLQTLQTYMTSSCSARSPVSRYFRTGQSLARLGVDWINTKEVTNIGATPPVPLYGGQLPVDAGSSTNIKIYRSSTA